MQKDIAQIKSETADLKADNEKLEVITRTVPTSKRLIQRVVPVGRRSYQTMPEYKVLFVDQKSQRNYELDSMDLEAFSCFENKRTHREQRYNDLQELRILQEKNAELTKKLYEMQAQVRCKEFERATQTRVNEDAVIRGISNFAVAMLEHNKVQVQNAKLQTLYEEKAMWMQKYNDLRSTINERRKPDDFNKQLPQSVKPTVLCGQSTTTIEISLHIPDIKKSCNGCQAPARTVAAVQPTRNEKTNRVQNQVTNPGMLKVTPTPIKKAKLIKRPLLKSSLKSKVKTTTAKEKKHVTIAEILNREFEISAREGA